MGREQHRGLLQARIAAAQDAERISPCISCRWSWGHRRSASYCREALEDGCCFGTGLQQVEIAFQSGGVFTFDPHRQSGQLFGAMLELGGAFRASRDDRRHGSLVPSDKALARCRLRSFPRISTMAPAARGSSSSALITCSVPEKWVCAEKRQRTRCRRSMRLSLRSLLRWRRVSQMSVAGGR